MMARTSDAADDLPDLACPGDLTVAVATLHPAYLSKSGHPTQLLATMQMTAVGSRPSVVVPSQQARRRTDEAGAEYIERFTPTDPRATTQLFLSTSRRNLREFAEHLTSTDRLTSNEYDIVKLEEFRLNTPADRRRLSAAEEGETVAELVLHQDSDLIFNGLIAYARSLDLVVELERRIQSGGMAFVPVKGTKEAIGALGGFSFTRAIRWMPRMRAQLDSEPLRGVSAQAFSPVLPDTEPVNSDLHVAVFDGGIPIGSPLARWVVNHTFPDSGPPDSEDVDHGHQVTSALLFGSIDSAQAAPVPYSYVDHYQVLDQDSESDPLELYTVIERIRSILGQRKYEFVNVSIGPDLPIEDDEIHAWTAFWDDHLSDGNTLATIATGNNGHLDRPSGNARIQVPADSVNAVGVGACDRTGTKWNRANYSAIGPGRSPGVVKPDVLAFGGSETEPFIVVDSAGIAEPLKGTSFAAPAALRAALGARTLFGDKLGPLDLKALLVHTAEGHGSSPATDIGHGRIASRLADMVICGNGEARVLYQGVLTPAKYLRAQIPLPSNLPAGSVQIKATLVYATAVDPADPGNYTRSGLDVTFRPHSGRYKNANQIHADPAQFFRGGGYETEAVLRRDAHKWDTVMHNKVSKRVTSLQNPVFDIHYNARQSGHATGTALPIRYSMVITVTHTKVSDLYEQILGAYATQLEALTPAVNISLDV
ncbi:S8 family peptidase [Nocardia tenerifensis]|nr:S8 family peptidase [Nocardia tenerifensis]